MTTDRRHALGEAGEDHAARHFERLGFEVLARRHRTRFGELDLVVRDGSLLVFAEVKTRRAGAGKPFDALGEVKQRQVRRMGAAWLTDEAQRPFFESLRFDAVGVTVTPGGDLVALEHLEGAF
jgi:putative endonuclease